MAEMIRFDQLLRMQDFFDRLGISREMFYRLLRSDGLPEQPRSPNGRVLWNEEYLGRCQRALEKRRKERGAPLKARLRRFLDADEVVAVG